MYKNTQESDVTACHRHANSHLPRYVTHVVKVQVYSLISSLKTYHPTLHLTTWSLDQVLFIPVPFQLHGEHTVLQPFRRIELSVHIAISVLPGTHFHLSQVKHLRVKCLAQGQNILTMSQYWEHDIFLKILYQAGFETARHAATSAERHALAIASCPITVYNSSPWS